MGALEYFISLLGQIRFVLDHGFIIPELGCSYWDFVIGLAIASVVVTVLVNTVRIGTVNYSYSRPSSKTTKTVHNEGGKASEFRAMSQRNSSGAAVSSNNSGGYRSNALSVKQPIYDRQGRRVG